MLPSIFFNMLLPLKICKKSSADQTSKKEGYKNIIFDETTNKKIEHWQQTKIQKNYCEKKSIILRQHF